MFTRRRIMFMMNVDDKIIVSEREQHKFLIKFSVKKTVFMDTFKCRRLQQARQQQ